MRKLMQAEYKKIVFLRFSKVYLVSLIVASLVLGVIFSLTTNVTQGRAITELPTKDVISANMLGVDLANVMLIIFTALLISSEFSTNLIHVSLAVTSNRKRFYFGKLMTYFLLSVAISVVTALLTYLAGQLILAIHHMSMATFLNSSIRQFVLGVMVMPVFYCVLTVAATFIFRSSGGGISFSLGIMAIPALIKMFSNGIQKIFLPILPQSAIHSLSGAVAKGSFEHLGLLPSICVLLAWIVITSFIALIKFEKRDI